MVDGLVLENDLVRLEFAPEHLGVARLLDKVSGVEHIRPGQEGYLLWELVFKHGLTEQTLANLGAPASRAEVTRLPEGGQRATMVWEDVRHWHEEDAVRVTVTVDLPDDDGVAAWRIAVRNHSNLWGLWEVRFPCVAHALSSEYDIAYAANNWGNLERMTAPEYATRFSYPSCEWALPFLSFTRSESSVYLGAHDPQVWTKSYKVVPGGKAYLGTFVENMAEVGSQYPGHYPVYFGAYQGDWLAACKRYRAWVLAQPWMPAPLSQRDDVPTSIKDTALWVREIWAWDNPETDPHTLNAPLLDAQEYYGVPLGVHWYLWHHNLFDKDYPYFFPARPGFAARVKELVDAGMLVMPYINTVIADIDHPRYRLELAPWTTKDQTGTPYYLPIAAFESGRMANMCPWTEAWQNVIAGLVDRLTGECGVNAVYLDLLSASPPDLCFDRGHGHPLGGGNWWWQGTCELLRKVKAIATARGVALTTESIADPYMAGAEGYLTWAPPRVFEIPMMPAVYSGYALYIGSPVSSEYDELAFTATQARALTWGCQPGWMAPDLHRQAGQETNAAYLRTVAHYRAAARAFLTYGELLTVLPAPEGLPTATFTWRDYTGKDEPTTLPAVLGSLWRAEDGALGVVLCNLLDAPVDYPLHLDAPRYGLDGPLRLEQITPEGTAALGALPAGPITRTESLAPREIRVLAFIPVRS